MAALAKTKERHEKGSQVNQLHFIKTCVIYYTFMEKCTMQYCHVLVMCLRFVHMKNKFAVGAE